MNKLLTYIIFFLSIFVYPSVCKSDGLLQMNVPSIWEMEYNEKGGSFFYAIINKGKENSLLTISNQPHAKYNELTQIKTEKIDFYMSKAEERLKNDPVIIGISRQKITGKYFSGQSVKMFHADGFILSLFVLSNGRVLLNGQFTGPKEKWVETLDIINSLKIKE